jgi:hypothetical protein
MEKQKIVKMILIVFDEILSLSDSELSDLI